jgi:3-deoxy-D-manno-octulosonic-acid transferase
MFAIYTILYSIALFLIAPFECYKRPPRLRGRWLRERLGIFEAGTGGRGTGRTSVWIHAVSVGEAASAVSFVKKLCELHPETDVVISTVTDTGQKVAMERMGDLARIIYVPFDIPWCIAGTVGHIKPDLFIIMETEIWPNLIRGLKRRGIPVILMNGRISEKSFRGYLRVKSLISVVLGCFDFLCMQEEQYAERIRQLGAPPDKVEVTGNLKFDVRPASAAPEWTKTLAGPVIVLGSSHHSEEDIVLDAFETLLKDIPDLNLILAPRHPERFAEVESLLRKRNLGYRKRSEIKDNAEAVSGLVVILDVMGELASVYRAADIAIMGGSFISRGGQNPLEPAYWGKAIICGQHMENFPFMEEFYSAGAALKTDIPGLVPNMQGLLSNPETLASMGRTARLLYDRNTGATERALEIIGRYI